MTDAHPASASLTDDEPETPAWLPALGFVLFVAVGLGWAVTPHALPSDSAPAHTEAPAAPVPVRAAQPPPPPPVPTVNPAPPVQVAAPPRPFPGAGTLHRDTPAKPAKKHRAAPIAP